MSDLATNAVAPWRQVGGVIGTIVVVLSQLPAVGIWFSWFRMGGQLDESSWDGLILLGFFSPPILISGWIVAVGTVLMSPRARRSIALWLALAVGISGMAMYDAAIGHF